MLQRAASNAYSWWWASHIRTKQSKWLEQNLQDMEEKVKYMLKLVEGEGDTFAKRAEIYFRQRPELITFVEEAYRAYRALAERYDHISGELQSANNTIATVFPEQIQYAMDEDDEDYDGSPRYPPRPVDQFKLSKDLPEPPKTMPKALSFQMSIKKTKKMAPLPTTAAAAPKSNLSKSEALELMDKFQKEILALQTEKEFVKSSYESRLARYWEIENRVTEVQEKVCNLQDEFSMSNVLEDDEARTLMATTALKSCQDTLVQLQETHGRSAEEVRIENHRIKVSQEKVEALKKKFRYEQMKQWNPFASDEDFMNDDSNLDEEVEILRQEDIETEAMVKNIREKLEMDSASSLTATEMAERIDELVKKIITLETMVSSPTGLINRLRLEIDELQECLRSSEDDEAKSNGFNVKLGQSEEKLHGIQDLNRNIEYQSKNLETEFTEASCNVDHLLEKLQSMQHLDEDENMTIGYQKEEVGQTLSLYQEFDFEELKDLVTASSDPANVTDKMNSINDLSQKNVELNLSQELLKQDLSFANFDEKEEMPEEEDEPNWQQLFMNGLEGREKALLAEYTLILRNFKDTKKQLSDIEKKNLDIISEVAVQLQELRNSNAMKDEEIRSLRQKLNLLQTNSDDNLSDFAFHDLGNTSTMDPKHQGLRFYQDQGVDSSVKRNKSIAFGEQGNEDKEGKRRELNIILIDEHQTLSSTEEKFRRCIDELLEENLEFWLRFSTSFHQIQKFQTVTQDLQAEFLDLTANNKQDDGSSPSKTTSTDKAKKSRARPLYVHLREIQTELDTWVEQSVSLKAELQSRFTSLCDIQEEITKALKVGAESADMEFTNYQAAKFQGEILNMKQENNKVADELQTGLDFVTGFQGEVETTLAKMNDELKMSESKKDQHDIKPSIRSRIPLRSFIFGIKQKKQKPSVFACINPAYQKQYSDLKGHIPL